MSPLVLLLSVRTWVAQHGHAMLGVAGLCAEGIAELGRLYGGPSWLQIGHVAFVALCAAGVVSTAGKSRVAAVEALVEQLVAASKDEAALPDEYKTAPLIIPASGAISVVRAP